jgi:hypothetical protein
MELWLSALLVLLALASLGLAIFLAVRYILRARAPKVIPPPEDPNDITLAEGVGLDDGTLTGMEISVPGPKPRARLRFTTKGIDSDILLDQPITSIGRGTGNQIDVGDLLASRRHARIILDDDGEYWIEDNQSANHTFVNGTTITRQKLSRDDKIKVGETILTFVRDRGGPTPRAG